MRIWIFFIGLLCFSCNLLPKKDKVPLVLITNTELKDFTNKFVESLISKGKKEKDITIYIKMIGDTAAVSIINSLPDLDMVKINGMLSLKGFCIYMTGVPLETFYQSQREEVHVPDKAILGRHKDKISDIKFSEPLVWYMSFVNDSLINCDIESKLHAFIKHNRAHKLINNIAQDFITIVANKKGDKEFQLAIKDGLKRFDDSGVILDSEDGDIICNSIEDLMDIVGLESSGGYLNTWRYGFDPEG